MKLNVVDNFNEQIYGEFVESRKQNVADMYDELRSQSILDTLSLLVATIGIALTFGFITRVATSSWIPFAVDSAVAVVVLVGIFIRHLLVSKDLSSERSEAELKCSNFKTRNLHEFYINNGELQLDHFNAGSVVLVGKDAKYFTIDAKDVDIVISDIPMTLKFDTYNIAIYIQKGAN